MKLNVGWQISINVRCGFKLQLTGMPEFHLLNNWYYMTTNLLSDVLEHPEEDTVIKKHSAEALDSWVKSLMHVIHSIEKEAQQNWAQWTIQIARP